MTKLIVEMEMPQACPCEFADSSSGIFTPCFAYYGVVERAAEFDKCARSGRRPEWCPIKGVLPEEHGDLIDRDALFLKYKEQYDFIDEEDILNAEAVIAAEGKDDE